MRPLSGLKMKLAGSFKRERSESHGIGFAGIKQQEEPVQNVVNGTTGSRDLVLVRHLRNVSITLRSPQKGLSLTAIRRLIQETSHILVYNAWDAISPV
jgi:hypothetical protein